MSRQAAGNLLPLFASQPSKSCRRSSGWGDWIPACRCLISTTGTNSQYTDCTQDYAPGHRTWEGKMAFCIVPDARLAVLFPECRARCCAGAKNLDRESWSRLPSARSFGRGLWQGCAPWPTLVKSCRWWDIALRKKSCAVALFTEIASCHDPCWRNLELWRHLFSGWRWRLE